MKICTKLLCRYYQDWKIKMEDRRFSGQDEQGFVYEKETEEEEVTIQEFVAWDEEESYFPFTYEVEG